MTFKKSGGLNDIYFKGYGELLSELPTNNADMVLESIRQSNQ